MPTIVVLDGQTLNPGDLNWSNLESLGTVTVYSHTPNEEILARSKAANILIVNKTPLSARTLQALPNLQYIGVSATGYNNVDIPTARIKGIPVCNVVGYSTPSVAQHVFALLLQLTNRPLEHHQSVVTGNWSQQPHFSYTLHTMPELAGRTMGIYGLGRIGQQVAVIAQAFGMDILATHKHPQRDAMPGVQFVILETLFSESDVLTLHAPLTPENIGIVNRKLLRKMKPTAYLINTGRGPLIVEEDLGEALREGWIAGAGIDVLSQEPPPIDHSLFQTPNLIITPHMAWSTQAARQRLLQATVDNVRAFLIGKPQNNVAS